MWLFTCKKLAEIMEISGLSGREYTALTGEKLRKKKINCFFLVYFFLPSFPFCPVCPNLFSSATGLQHTVKESVWFFCAARLATQKV